MPKPAPNLEHCPSANLCAMTAPDAAAPECGALVEHVSPLIASEDLCLRALSNYSAAEHHKSRTGVTITPMGPRLLLEQAGSTIDQAMMRSTSDDAAAQHFDSARTTLDTLLDVRSTVLDMQLKAATLRLYLPLFQERRQGRQASLASIAMVAEGLTIFDEAIDRAEIHTIQTHKDHLAEPDHRPCLGGEVQYFSQKWTVAGILLALQQGILPYPSLPRESSSPDVDRNHHWYVLDQQGEKIPFKLQSGWKRRKVPKPRQPVAQLGFAQMVAQSVDENMLHRYDYQHRLPDIIQRKARGEHLRPSADATVQAVGGLLIKELSEQQQRRQQGKKALPPPFVSFDPNDVFPLPERQQHDILDAKVITDLEVTETGWTILPEGTIDDVLGALATVDSEKDTRIEQERIAKLKQIAHDWGPEAYLAVANLDPVGGYDYIAAILPDQKDGVSIEHAIAENPHKGNALYVYRVDSPTTANGTPTPTWRDVLSTTKKQAIGMGAKRLIHTDTLDERLLDYLTAPTDRV